MRNLSDDNIAEFAEELRQAVGTFVRRVRSGAGTPSSAQSETLGLLHRQGALTTAELARLRSVKHQSMRLVIGELDAEGLIERTANPDDARSQRVIITDKGAEFLSVSQQARSLWIAQALKEKLSSKERQTMRDAVVLLRRISEER